MNSNFRHNPFSGILKEEVKKTLVPRFDVGELVSRINNTNSIAVEFLGKQGRGKTSHLLYLHEHVEDCPLYLLNARSDVGKIMKDESKIIFIDSIHHLALVDRIRLFKKKRILVYTTHWSRKLECVFAQMPLYTIRFKGINQSILKEIIDKRVFLASKGRSSVALDLVPDQELHSLIQKYGDDYRGIINHLYERFQ